MFFFIYCLNMDEIERKPDFVACEQQGRRPASAFTQSDQCLCYLVSGK